MARGTRTEIGLNNTDQYYLDRPGVLQGSTGQHFFFVLPSSFFIPPPETVMLDEKALRRPGFSEGYKVVLADGQEWTLPKPRIRFKPRIVEGRVEIGGGPCFGPEFDDRLDILFGITEAEPAERLRVKFEVAVRLLAANYNLTPANFAELIVLEPGDSASDERWEQLSNAIMGIAPKPSPAI